MKKYFITGLIILLPVALTLFIIAFLFNLLTEPFLGAVKAIFERYHLFAQGFLFLNAVQLQTFIAKVLIVLLLVLFTGTLGFLARWFFFNSLLKLADFIVHRIPIVRTVYKTSQDLIRTIFSSDTRSFKQVVLVKFPNPHSYSIGLVTREDGFPGLDGTGHEKNVAVFVPTTPNPTSGFLILFKPEDLVYLDMSVEEAFKYIISCGMILPTFKSVDLAKEATK